MNTSTPLPVSGGFHFKLGDIQMVGYGALFVAYNVGLSPVFGIVRLLIAVPYFLKHKKDAETYQKVHEAVVENKLNNASSDEKRNSVEVQLAGVLLKLKNKIFAWYSEVTYDRMTKFWFYQILRALTEIFIPHVGPQIWTFRDFTCEGIFKQRLSTPLESPSNLDEETYIPTFELNIAGNRELEKALKWEEKHEQTISDPEVNLKATLRSVRTKKNVKRNLLKGHVRLNSKVKHKLDLNQKTQDN